MATRVRWWFLACLSGAAACSFDEPVVAHEAAGGADPDALDLDALQALAMINEPDLARTQPYARRHALLERLATTRDAGRVDRRLNLALDLLQAGEAPRPCAVFREALERIAAAKDRYYLEAVTRARIPGVTGAGTHPDEPCEGLEAFRLTLARTLGEPMGAAVAAPEASAASDARPVAVHPVAEDPSAPADPVEAAQPIDAEPEPIRRKRPARPSSVSRPKPPPFTPGEAETRPVAGKLDDGLKPFRP